MFVLFNACASLDSQQRQEDAALHLQLGSSLLSNQSYPQALSEFLKAEQLDPQNPIIQNNLALAYFARERFDLAETHLKKALSINSEFTEAKNNLGRVYIEQTKYNDAEKILNQALEDLTYPEADKVYFNLGLSAFRQNKFSDSKRSFLKALEIRRNSCRAQTYYGRSLYELKDFQLAAIQLDRAISFCENGGIDEAQYYSGLSYYNAGQLIKAEDRLSELIKLYPDGAYFSRANKILKTIRK